ncbi:MAG: radical SAM protein [bacterium]
MNDVFKKGKHRILLVRPFFEMQENELVFLPFEPLGLQYIQSALLAHGHEVKIYDCLVEHPRNVRFLPEKNLFHCGSEKRHIAKEVKKFKPDIIGISGMFYAQASSFYQTADLAKEADKDIFVFGGGAFPSSYKAEVMRECKSFDAIVLGEGEETAVDLADNLDNLAAVKGICFRKLGSGEIIYNQARPVQTDLDKIIFPHRGSLGLYNYSKPAGYGYSRHFNLKKLVKSWILYASLSVPGIRYIFARFFNWRHRNKPKALFMPHGFIITSRGCPNRCTFCAIHAVWGETYRIRSSKNVLDEIDILVKHGAKEIVIVDDNFTVSKSRTIEICKGIIERKHNVRLVTPSGVFLPSLDKEALEYLYKAGLRELQFGVENGDQEFLDKVICKNLRLEKIKEIIAQAKEVGLRTRGFFIFGYPGETRQTMIKTLKFAFESGMDGARFYVFQPLPGTKAFQMAQEMGALDNNLELDKLRLRPDMPVVQTKDFSKEDVMKIFNLAYDIIKERNYEKIKDKIPEILGWE